MPGDVVLDTSVVVAHLHNDKTVTQRLRDAGVLYLSATAAGELWFGVGRAADPVNAAAKLTDFLSIVTLLPVDAEIAQSYGEIKCKLAKDGRPIPENDIWIAACAVQNALPLAARDPHFTRIEGLELLDW